MSDEPKSHGLLFKSEMIVALNNTKPDMWPAKAIDPDRPWKWQTRRPMDPQPVAIYGLTAIPPHKKAQVIYAKETHYRWGRFFRGKWRFRDDAFGFDRHGGIVRAKSKSEEGWHRKPAILMPRSGSQIWLRVMNVRVERVNEISESDALAEGISWPDLDGRPYRPPIDTTGMSTLRIAAARYGDLWDSINGAGDFAKGKFVWVYDLARISKP